MSEPTITTLAPPSGVSIDMLTITVFHRFSRIWDTSTGQCLRTLVHEDNPAVANACFSPNGRFVLAFSLDNCIRLWDYVSGSVKKTYQGHKNSGFSIGGGFAMLGDSGAEGGLGSGAFVVSASEDGDIVLWDVKSKEIVQRITRAHKEVCFWVDVHGDTMVSAGKDATIKVYKNKAPTRMLRSDINGTQGGVASTNGVNGHADSAGLPEVTDAQMADEELQRHVEAEDTLQIKDEDIKMEET